MRPHVLPTGCASRTRGRSLPWDAGTADRLKESLFELGGAVGGIPRELRDPRWGTYPRGPHRELESLQFLGQTSSGTPCDGETHSPIAAQGAGTADWAEESLFDLSGAVDTPPGQRSVEVSYRRIKRWAATQRPRGRQAGTAALAQSLGL